MDVVSGITEAVYEVGDVINDMIMTADTDDQQTAAYEKALADKRKVSEPQAPPRKGKDSFFFILWAWDT